MIETAVQIIAERGVTALSISALARRMGINRTTVYYHFESRDALIAAVKIWSAAQLAKAFNSPGPPSERMDYISHFVLENPELMKLWIDDFIAVGNIRDRYPYWDALVSGIGKDLESEFPDEEIDPEVYCVMMLTGAFIGPRVYKNSVRPDDDINSVVGRFRQVHQHILRRDRLPSDKP